MTTKIGDLFSQNSQYSKKLNSPEWREFTSQVRKNRGNACQSCRRSNITLNVHHVFYDKAREPWEYCGLEIALLCEPCHKQLHANLQQFRQHVFGKLSPQTFQVLNGALAVALEKYDPLVFVHALAEFVSNANLVQKYADAWQMQARKDDDRWADEAHRREMCRKLKAEQLTA